MSPLPQWLDGPGLVTWLSERLDMEGLCVSHPTIARRIREWSRRGKASVYCVDRALVELGHHLSEVPEDLYIAVPPPRVVGPRKKHPRRFQAVILAWWGYSVMPIAEELSISDSTVRAALTDAGIPLPGRVPNPKHDEALRLYREGVTLSKIEQRLRVPDSTISMWVRKAGLPMRKATA